MLAGMAGGSSPKKKLMQSDPRVAIITLNWNGKEDTLALLESLRHLDYADIEIVAVYQNSNDGSCEAIADDFPEVTVIRNNDNLGFAEGNNVGIQYALDAGAEYIVLLNNDTTVEPNFIRNLVDTARAMADFDVFGPKIVFYDEPNIIWAAGSDIDWKEGVCTQRGYGEEDCGQHDIPVEVNALTGCAIMISRRVFERIGLFDGRFYLYYEETDWCARATKAGFRILYAPGAVVRHKVSSTIGSTSPALVFYMVRNNLLFILENSRGFRRVWLLVKRLCIVARTICTSLVKGKREDAFVRMRAAVAFITGRFGRYEV